MRRAAALVLILGSAATLAAAADDSTWPQWLGPTRDGRATLASVPSPRLTVAWKKPLGGGGSGIVSADGRVFTLSPWPIPTYWRWTKTFDASEYDFA